MRLALSSDQTAIADAVAQALAGSDPTLPRGYWGRLADVGLTSALLAPEEDGLGLTEADLIAALVESGRWAVPVPLVETALVAARLLSGTEHAELLAGGKAWITAVLDPSGLAPWTAGSDGVLAGNERGVRWIAPGDALTPVPALDPGRPLGQVPAGAGTLVCADPSRIARARRAGMLGTAAQLLGLAQRALDLTVTYTSQRQQFGTPIGTFQAVKHQLADAFVAADLARPLVWAAAWSHSRDDPAADRDVAAAKLRAGEAAALAARAALQCHGGMGYTREHELHRWLLRIWALRAAWGAPGELLTTLQAALGLDAQLTGQEPVSTDERTRTDA